jgi:ATP-dependent RNA helicase RhlE
MPVTRTEPGPSNEPDGGNDEPFAALKVHPSLVRSLRALGFQRPTPVQTQAIPPALEGRDLLATAMTGSGKTAGFLLPILHHLIGRPRGATRALVLTPTRELAAQVLADLRDYAAHSPITGAAVFGGVGMGPQEHAFRRGVDVVVGTPGRLLDHFKAPYAKLAALEYLVLDEADRMLDMGFLPDIRRILRHLPARRQTLFFSATMPPPIAALARDILRNPVTIDVDRPVTPAVGITHAVYPVAQELKAALLLALLERGDIRDALVFTRTKHRADRLARYLAAHDIRVERIHGNRSQSQRTEALAGFKSRKYRVLVATDIAARGIDIAALGHVVNFDTPPAAEDYVHRVGRTARAEAVGTAFTFVAPDEEGNLRTIERTIGGRLPRVTLRDFDYSHRQAPALEVPRHERIAAIRKRNAQRREAGTARAARRTSGGPGPRRPARRPSRTSRP